MIIKDISYAESAGSVTVRDAAGGCSGCQQSCAAKWLLPTLERDDRETTALQIGVSGVRLSAVVAVLFGLPLLLLFTVVAIMEQLGLVAQPLLVLAVLACALAALASVLIRQGTKLLQLLQVQTIDRPDIHLGNRA